MKFLCAIVLGLTWVAATAATGAPPQNLWVELRWVDSAISAAAVGGTARGAVVIGTAGSVSPQPGQTLSTATRAAAALAASPRVRVLNGQSASIRLTEQQHTQTVDFALDMPWAPPQTDVTTFVAASASAAVRVIASPRTSTVELSHGFVVRPSWPGGRLPVRVELQAFGASTDGRHSVSSTVLLPLGDWLTVARHGATVGAPESVWVPGRVSSDDAAAQPGRELQLRVSLAP